MPNEVHPKDHYPPIGVLRTVFTEKFGVPRQSLMVPEARGVLKLNPEPAFRAALQHLEQFSHIWLVFVFHRNGDRPWQATIEPPRIDAPKGIGVFASRSPHRPNPIGLSAVKLDRIDYAAVGGIELHLSGVDILNDTPVLDIKPYLPYADRVPEANSGWAETEITRYPVEFSPGSLAVISTPSAHPNLQALIREILEWDPRPTSQRRTMPIGAEGTDGMIFAFRLLQWDVRWQIRGNGILVLELLPLPA